jgi:hypothetical protein
LTQPEADQTRTHPNRAESRRLVPARHVTRRKGVRAATSANVSAWGEASVNRARVRGRLRVRTAAGSGCSHWGGSVKTTIRSVTPTT